MIHNLKRSPRFAHPVSDIGLREAVIATTVHASFLTRDHPSIGISGESVLQSVEIHMRAIRKAQTPIRCPDNRAASVKFAVSVRSEGRSSVPNLCVPEGQFVNYRSVRAQCVQRRQCPTARNNTKPRTTTPPIALIKCKTNVQQKKDSAARDMFPIGSISGSATSDAPGQPNRLIISEIPNRCAATHWVRILTPCTAFPAMLACLTPPCCK